MKTICLSAGHTPSGQIGARYEGLNEEELTIKIVKAAAPMLRAHDVPVLEVPDNLTLEQTIKWINERKDQIDVALEVHINSGGGTGVEAWYYHNFQTGKGDVESKALAQWVVDAVVAETGMADRGVKDESTNRWGKLGFVHDTTPLSALVECGFLQSKYDRDLLSSDKGIVRVAKGVARGLVGYLGGTWTPSLLNEPTNPIQPSNPPVPTPPQVPQYATKAEVAEMVALMRQELATYQSEISGFAGRVTTVENKLTSIKTLL